MKMEKEVVGFMRTFIIPEAAAFYIYTFYNANKLGKKSLEYHYCNALLLCGIGEIDFIGVKDLIITILEDRYDLITKSVDPLILENKRA